MCMCNFISFIASASGCSQTGSIELFFCFAVIRVLRQLQASFDIRVLIRENALILECMGVSDRSDKTPLRV